MPASDSRTITFRAPAYLADEIDAAVKAHKLRDRTALCLKAIQEHLLQIELSPGRNDATAAAIRSVEERLAEQHALASQMLIGLTRLTEHFRAQLSESKKQGAAFEAIVSEVNKLNRVLSAIGADQVE